MRYREINTEFALKKITKKDGLFNGDYTIDPYQNCAFSCSYCDSSIDKTIYVKRNIIKVLEKKLKKIPKSNIIIGSVHDPYQKIEEQKELTKNILKLIEKYKHSCHILTKSNLVLRDIDLLKKIEDITVTITITTYNNRLREIFEKNVMSAKNRIKVIKKLTGKNIYSGIALIPIIPYINEGEIGKIIKESKNDSKYYLYRYLELKGEQKELFLKIIYKNFPKIYNNFSVLYDNSILPCKKYINKTDLKIKNLFEKYQVKDNVK